MNHSIIRRILGWVLMMEGVFFLLPALVGVCYREFADAKVYCILAAVSILAGLAMRSLPLRSKTFYAREGFVAVALSWILLSLVGALPFYITRDIPMYIDALFEIISGFTTTGSSIMLNVELMSHANLFWRSFSHWVGGMGVLVFILAILPMTGGSTMKLMKAESPGPSVGKLVPKLQRTAFLLYAIYFAMTMALVILLVICGMPVFEAFCHSFGTAGTGGFGVHGDSIAGYSALIQNIITVFMLLFGVNFSFYYYLLIKHPREALGMEEVRWYLVIYFAVVCFITANLMISGSENSVLDSFRIVAFQVASVMTTTGYATADFDMWPMLSRAMMVAVMFIGACAGSTGGGIKVSRIMLYVKQVKIELHQQIHPRSIKVLKMDGKSVDKNVIRSANVFLLAYLLIFVFSILVITNDGFDLTTSFTSVVATINNIGPGLGKVGPTGNFSEFSNLSKIVFMFDMLAGRLEVIPMLAIFFPATWRR